MSTTAALCFRSACLPGLHTSNDLNRKSAPTASATSNHQKHHFRCHGDVSHHHHSRNRPGTRQFWGTPLKTSARVTPQRGQGKVSSSVWAGINIDRRRHLEEAFKRQLELEQQEEEDSGTCPVDCVTPVRNLIDFQKVLDAAEANDDLVVVDFYNAACGSCKYILPQFVKMCKSGGQGDGGMGGVVFVKHDVRDEYDELTDLARFYRIRMVPMFAFFQDGSRKEQIATRDKRRVEATIKALLSRRQEFEETYGQPSQEKVEE